MPVELDLLLTSARLATMSGPAPYGLIDAGAVGLAGDQIAWVGKNADAPAARSTIDCAGRLVTPGLIDCHTHVVFGGNRAREFEMRLEGASYEEIARAGGGIVSTVAANTIASTTVSLSPASRRNGPVARIIRAS